MEINRTFTEKDYTEAVEFANFNNYRIEEVERNEQGERQFKVVENKISEENELSILRTRREIECFSIINRGQLWYNTLTEEQKNELDAWYKTWLDVTETMVIPEKPSWLED